MPQRGSATGESIVDDGVTNSSASVYRRHSPYWACRPIAAERPVVIAYTALCIITHALHMQRAIKSTNEKKTNQKAASETTLLAEYAMQGLSTVACPSVCLSIATAFRSTSAAGASQSISAGARAAAAGSDMLRAEVRGSMQTGFETRSILVPWAQRTINSINLQKAKIIVVL